MNLRFSEPDSRPEECQHTQPGLSSALDSSAMDCDLLRWLLMHSGMIGANAVRRLANADATSFETATRRL